MQIGIFGDSFATSWSQTNLSWGYYVTKILQVDSPTHLSIAGTSHWWSFEQFLKHYKEFDTIVFCHTYPTRWPSLPAEYTGYQWDIGKDKAVKATPDYLHKVNKFFLDIFPERLLDAISEYIFKKVEELCTEANISLVHITVDEQNTEMVKHALYPVLGGISRVSYMEKTMHKGKDMLFGDVLKELNTPDIRPCHLLPANNVVLARLLVDRINDNSASYTSLIDLPIWHTHDPVTYDWFK